MERKLYRSALVIVNPKSSKARGQITTESKLSNSSLAVLEDAIHGMSNEYFAATQALLAEALLSLNANMPLRIRHKLKPLFLN
jgi:hypothetical protein